MYRRATVLVFSLFFLLCLSTGRLCAASVKSGQSATADGGSPTMRRLVIYLDGTWDNAEQGTVVEDRRTRFKPTNVLKLYRATVPRAGDGTQQISYYAEGVGSQIGEKIRLGGFYRLVDRL